MGQSSLKVEGKKQAVGLDIARDVDGLSVAIFEVDCGEVDAWADHSMTDAASAGGNLIEDAAFSDR